MTHSRSEQGNALFIILIAVALFAALSYAVTQSGRTSAVIDRDTARLHATELIEYVKAIETAMRQLELSHRCDRTQISFEHDGDYINPTAPDRCKLFSGEGGKLARRRVPRNVNDGSDWLFTGGPVMHRQGGHASDFTDSNADLAVVLFSMNKIVCEETNRLLGISGVPVNGGSYTDVTKFTGTFTATENVSGLPGAQQPSPCAGSPAEPNLCGKKTGCFREEGGSQRFIFISRLL